MSKFVTRREDKFHNKVELETKKQTLWSESIASALINKHYHAQLVGAFRYYSTPNSDSILLDIEYTAAEWMFFRNGDLIIRVNNSKNIVLSPQGEDSNTFSTKDYHGIREYLYYEISTDDFKDLCFADSIEFQITGKRNFINGKADKLQKIARHLYNELYEEESFEIKYINCPQCGTSFQEREGQCPQCGCTKQEIEQIEEKRRIQAEKEAEERRIQAEKEAEEARIRAEQEAAEQAARRKEWWQENWKKVLVVVFILIAVIAVIATFKNISNQKSIALANQYIASGDSCVAIYQFDKAEQFYYSAANSTKDGKTLNIINQKHYDLNGARGAADYEYDQSLKRLKILLEADNYVFNKYSNQELDKMIKIYPNRQETIYYQNLRKQ